jgi:hypothetical protein
MFVQRNCKTSNDVLLLGFSDVQTSSDIQLRRWRQYVSPKRWHLPTSLHGEKTQKKNIIIITAVKNSNLIYKTSHYVIFSILPSPSLLKTQMFSLAHFPSKVYNSCASPTMRSHILYSQTSRIIIFRTY